MMSWKQLLVVLVVITLGLVVIPTASVAADWGWGGDFWLMGDPDGGGGYTGSGAGQGVQHDFRAGPVPHERARNRNEGSVLTKARLLLIFSRESLRRIGR